MSQPYERMVDVVLSVLVSDGFEGVSVRKVAARAEVSIGAVQHHFPTKDAMLQAAMDAAARRFRQRLAERMDPAMPAAEQLETIAIALACADGAERETAVTWLLRLARAAVNEQVARRHREEWQALETMLSGLIAAAAPAVDAADAAAELLALLDGLAGSAAVEPERISAERAERIVRAHVRRLVASDQARSPTDSG
ncbi:TetR/AcrR family transcriptional regulator [Mycolicibacterium thermoresistibile]